MATIKAVDLFAGCGGLSLGFENAGCEIVAAFENWGLAADCYEQNFRHPVYRTDLNNVDEAVSIIQALDINMIIGGPPCQDFSHAGKRVEASRASLTESYAQIISKIKPKYFLMENVDRAQKSQAYATAREIYKESGYGITERVLTASYCGVPQRRKRFFCIGILGEEDGVLDAILSKNLSNTEMTLRDYFGDSLDLEFYYRHPRNYSRRGVFSIDEPAPTMRGVNRPVPKGYPGHPKDAGPVTQDLRPLTTLERSLVQTFPSNFKWVGSKTDREQMVGNAVPVNLGTYVAKALIEHIEQSEYHDSEIDSALFQEWLSADKGLSERSSRDTVSRLSRANKLHPLSSETDLQTYIFELGRKPDFESLSPSVRSQLKRAVKLYSEFRN